LFSISTPVPPPFIGEQQRTPVENSAPLLNIETGLMHLAQPENHNENEQHQLLLLATF
jgi:hypothetical protein